MPKFTADAKIYLFCEFHEFVISSSPNDDDDDDDDDDNGSGVGGDTDD